jgi:caa(3)-type oxidase subunit IV
MDPHAATPGDASPTTGATIHTDPREVLTVFGGLLLILAIEVALVKMPGIARGSLTLALLALAAAKAVLIGFFYMHLKSETRVLRWTVLGPLSLPGLYALALMADAAWRLLR